MCSVYTIGIQFYLVFIDEKGVEAGTTYENLGLPLEWFGAMEWMYPTWVRKHPFDTGATVNLLKGAIVTADRILTVSKVIILPSYFYFFS